MTETHPIMAGADDVWEFGPSLWAWWVPGAGVVVQGEDGDVTIPPDRLILLARALMAAGVTASRPEWRAPGGGQ